VEGFDDSLVMLPSSLYSTAVVPADVLPVSDREEDIGDVGGGIGSEVGRRGVAGGTGDRGNDETAPSGGTNGEKEHGCGGGTDSGRDLGVGWTRVQEAPTSASHRAVVGAARAAAAASTVADAGAASDEEAAPAECDPVAVTEGAAPNRLATVLPGTGVDGRPSERAPHPALEAGVLAGMTRLVPATPTLEHSPYEVDALSYFYVTEV